MQSTKFLREFLSNLQTETVWSKFGRCPLTWGETDVVPDVNRFSFFVSGEGYIKIENRIYYPKPGELFLMPAGVKQSYGTTGPNTFERYICHFTAKIGDRQLFDILRMPYSIKILNESDRYRLVTSFEELVTNYESDKITAKLRVKAALIEIICFFLDHNQIEKVAVSSSTSMEKIYTVLQYIERNLTEIESVEELAELVHLHPNYFIQFFKKIVGVSPMHYVHTQKMDKAKHLLATTDISISDLAEILGFPPDQFSKAFKKATSCSPSVYRSFDR